MSNELPPHLEIPDQPRHLRFYRFQWVGLPILFAVPLLALFGVFGDSRAQGEDSTAELRLHVEYATRYRYKQVRDIRVTLENVSRADLDSVVVRFDAGYILGFSVAAMLPEPDRPFDVDILDLRPGETRLIRVELEGHTYGRQEGTITASRPGSPEVLRVPIRTFIYP